MKILLVFPHQLFEDSDVLSKLDKTKDLIFIIEDYLFFRQYKFHKQKLILHRASMKFYERYLVDLGYKTKYVNSDDLQERSSLIFFLKGFIGKNKIKNMLCYEVVDNWLEKDLLNFSKNVEVELVFFKTPMFLNTKDENKIFFTKADGSSRKPFMKTFYEWQRNRLNILMYEKNIPVGGKYSFDEDNRKKLPKDYVEPNSINFTQVYKENKTILEAKKYLEENFENNYGDLDEFNYAISHTDAKKVLQHFLEFKFKDFGIYEDSISTKFAAINHSVLTPYLNIGLLTPSFVVSEVLKYAEKVKGTNREIPLNSLEGFLRQIIGWREFMRAMYDLHGTKMRNSNFFEHTKKLEESWWTGKVEANGVKIEPVNVVIKNLLKYAYNHHIERLMVLGNFMLLSQYDPDEIYKWFMSMYIDSYDWVMVPNVYGMSQFADGGIFATKPYISGSNYIFKMSDYKKSESVSWVKIWDDLFWGFLKKHKVFFSKNIRFKMLLSRIKD